MRILVAEDDAALARALCAGLEHENYAVECVADGDAALQRALDGGFDLLLLDLGLPKRSGFDVLTPLRRSRGGLPVLVLSALGTEDDRVRGLDSGADDYLVKPFSHRELCARVRALLRRSGRENVGRLHVGPLELDRIERRAHRGGRSIGLTPREFALLECLMLHPNCEVSREMILAAWDSSAETAGNLVDVYINYVRTKVDDGFEPRLIRTIRGIGYRISDDGWAEAASGCGSAA